MQISDRIKKYKKDNKLTYPKMAVLLGVSFDTLKNWSMGRFKPSEENMVKLEKLFKELK